MLERPDQRGERAVLVHLQLTAGDDQELLSEFKELVRSAGAEPVVVITGKRYSPHPKTFAGKGKVEEIAMMVKSLDADLVMFNHAISPTQERNLEKIFCCRVVDRTGLILDIFAQRARSFEGKLQVELAQLKRLSTRLVRGWTHLERQKGGIGLRGPGETQLETDRRLITQRIKQLNRRLKKVQEQRHLGRNTRQRSAIQTVSLVGYTNAGKSTLFNQLTGASVYVADQLFATLDSTLRKLEADTDQEIVVSDTVGFIRHLPHDLVAAFRSTLEETVEANLLIHVVDAADPEQDTYIEQVNEVLSEIGAADIPVLTVFNKIDLTDIVPHIDYDSEGKVNRVWLCAQSGHGLDLLKQVLVETLLDGQQQLWIKTSAENGRTRAKLHAMGVVIEEKLDDKYIWNILIDISTKDLEMLIKSSEFDLSIDDTLTENLAGQAQAS